VSPLPRALAIVLLLAAAGCAQLQEMTNKQPDAAPKPAAPQITEDMLRDRAKEQLATGVKLYEQGEFDSASRSLNGALEHGLLAKPDQARARKLLAFIHCVLGREAQCRDEFRKAFEIYPDFALTAAEDGHPIWGPVYRNVRTQLVTEREAAQARRSTSLLPLNHPEQTLQDALVKYDSGDYDAALVLLENALKEGLRDKADQVRAIKFTAFSQCLKQRYPQCRAAFLKIYELNPDFDLTPAEAGHPSWTKTFASAKAHAKKLMAEKAAKESKEKSAKDKGAPPPTASVPKKNN
jgi:tetratricopeptide (TPR) repeat protein